MTRHPLLWITATAVALGAGTWAAVPVGAQEILWNVTIDVDAVVASHDVVVRGTVDAPPLVTPSSVTVTLTPDKVLHAACGSAPVVQTVPLTGVNAYEATVPVPCNGPYVVSAVGRGTGLVGEESSPSTTQPVGVAEAPPKPPRPRAEANAIGGLTVSWDANDDLDAAGWILVTAGGNKPYPAGQFQAELGPELRGSTLAVRSVRWGASGPDGETIMSQNSSFIAIDPGGPPVTQPPTTQPPSTLPPTTNPGPGGPGGPGPGGTPGTNPPTTGGTTPPSTTGSTSTLPDGYTEELPYGVPDDAFVPGEEPLRTSVASTGDERAASASPPAGLVHIGDKRSPGLVAPFALGLLMITIAAHIAWYLRRSKPPGGGQVTPG